MDKRLINFMLVSLLIIIGYTQITMILFPPPPKPVVEEGANPNLGGDDPIALDPNAVVDSDAANDVAVAEVDPDVANDDVVPAVPAKAATLQRVTFGSIDPASGFPMLVTCISQGGAIERVELSDPRYRDSVDKSAYIGHLAVDANRDGGVRVNVVGHGTPAARAGIQAGDVITKVGDETVDSATAFKLALRKFEAGADVPLGISSSGASKQIVVKSMRRPLEVIRPEPTVTTPDNELHQPSYLLGLRHLGPNAPDYSRLELAAAPSLRNENWSAQFIDNNGSQTVEFRFPIEANIVKQFGGDGAIEFIKRFTLRPGTEEDSHNEANYHFDFEVEIVNRGQTALQVGYLVDGPTGLPLEGWWYSYKTHPNNFGAAGVRDLVWRAQEGGHEVYTNAAITKQQTKDPTNPRLEIVNPLEPQQLAYAGVDSQYFHSALLAMPDNKQPFLANRAVGVVLGKIDVKKTPVIGPEGKPGGNGKLTDVTFRIDSPIYNVRPNQSEKQQFQIFAGPKKPSVLAHYGLDECIVYGWFWWAAKPMGFLLHKLYAVVGNYGIAIILLTLLVRACMFPAGRAQAMSAKKMQELTPEIKKIKAKYPDDMAKQSAAQQELFRKHKYNPVAGCLPMIFQLPLFIGLYRALSVDIELRQAPLIPGLDWCSNLAAPDMLWHWADSFQVSVLTGYTGWLGPYLNVLPLISMVLFMVHQQMFTPPPTDEQQEVQQKVMKFMTLFIGVLFFKVPSGLCLYFITSSLWALGERIMLPKKDDQAEKTHVNLAEKRKAESATAAKTGKSGSLTNGTASKKSRRKKNRK